MDLFTVDTVGEQDLLARNGNETTVETSLSIRGSLNESNGATSERDESDIEDSEENYDYGGN